MSGWLVIIILIICCAINSRDKKGRSGTRQVPTDTKSEKTIKEK